MIKHRGNSLHVLEDPMVAGRVQVYFLEPSAKGPFRLVVISDLGFSCKLRVKQLHLLDIFLSQRRMLELDPL